MAVTKLGRRGLLVDTDVEELHAMARDRSKLIVPMLFSPPRLGTRLWLARLEYQYFTPLTPRADNLQLYTYEWRATQRWTLGFIIAVMPWYMKDKADKIARLTNMVLWDGVPTVFSMAEHPQTRHLFGGNPLLKTFAEHKNVRGIRSSRPNRLRLPSDIPFPFDTKQVWTLEWNTKKHPFCYEAPLSRARLVELIEDETRRIDEVYRTYGAPGHKTEAEFAAEREVDAMEWRDDFGSADEYADAIMEEWPDHFGGV